MVKIFKHIPLLIISIFLFSPCPAQIQKFKQSESFKLSGELIGRDTGFIILGYPGAFNKYIRDTAYLKKDGAFEFDGKISEPSFAHLMAYHREGNYTDIYLAAGSQTVTLEENDFSAAKIGGSFTQKESDSLNERIHGVEVKYKQLYDDYDSANSKYRYQKDSIFKKRELENLDNLNRQLQIPNSEIEDLKIEFIRRHPNSYVSPTELYGLINSLSYDSAQSLFSSFSRRIKESRTGKLCLLILNKKRNTKAGTVAPNFTSADISGKNISINQFKGKYLLLDFWASWCVPCRQNSPALIKLFKKYHKKGLEIIGISDDKNSLAWEKAIKKDGIGIWNNILSKKIDENWQMDPSYSISDVYEVHYIPTKILIDTSGIIIGRYGGLGDEDNSALYEKLKEIFK